MTGPGVAVGRAACVAVACLLLGAGGAAGSDAGTDVPFASEEQKAKYRSTSRLTTSPLVEIQTKQYLFQGFAWLLGGMLKIH